ncbi:MAG: Ldh family oxidoreductase [Rhodospirillaceae bacterium]
MAGGAPTPVRVRADDLTRCAAGIFETAGLSPEHALMWSESLVWANLRGVDTHGVLRVPRYMELVEIGGVNPTPEMKVLLNDGPFALVNVDKAPGPVGMKKAAELAIERAKEAKIGWCIAQNTSHSGAIGQFALEIAEAGFAAIVMAASRPFMSYYGSKGPVVSTNPIAIAVPAKDRGPIVFDMSTATVPLGKIMAARRNKTPLEEGWAVDANGAPATDPDKAVTVAPMAGPKGSGLSLMIECLVSLMGGNPVLTDALNGDKEINMNGAAIALDPAAFGPAADYRAQVSSLAEVIGAQPTNGEVDKLLLPGERGDLERERRMKDGIPLPKGVWDALLAAAETAGVAPPETI